MKETCTKGIALLLLLADLTVFPQSNERKSTLYGQLNTAMHFEMQMLPGDAIFYRRGLFESALDVFFKSNRMNRGEYYSQARTKLEVLLDRPRIQAVLHPEKIELRLLFTLDDDFARIVSFFSGSKSVFFIATQAKRIKGRVVNGIYRFNRLNWYDFVCAADCDNAMEMEPGRFLGFKLQNVNKIVRTNQNFLEEMRSSLPNARLRQEFFKVNESQFFFHNARIFPEDCAIEVYSKKILFQKEFFQYLPYDFKRNPANIPLASQTVAGSDGKGKIFLAFQYDRNPYRIWVFDSQGKKGICFGNRFESESEYTGPHPWYDLSTDEIARWGIQRMYTLQKIFNTTDGHVVVAISKHRTSRAHGIVNDVVARYLDVFDGEGRFVGRSEFTKGTPIFMDKNDRIYAIQPGNSPKINVVQLALTMDAR